MFASSARKLLVSICTAITYYIYFFSQFNLFFPCSYANYYVKKKKKKVAAKCDMNLAFGEGWGPSTDWSHALDIGHLFAFISFIYSFLSEPDIFRFEV